MSGQEEIKSTEEHRKDQSKHALVAEEILEYLYDPDRQDADDDPKEIQAILARHYDEPEDDLTVAYMAGVERGRDLERGRSDGPEPDLPMCPECDGSGTIDVDRDDGQTDTDICPWCGPWKAAYDALQAKLGEAERLKETFGHLSVSDLEAWGKEKARADALEQERDRLKRANALLLDASLPNHTGHWDSRGTSGANCPECLRARELREQAAALAATGGEGAK